MKTEKLFNNSIFTYSSFNEETRKASVSNKNVILYYHYLRNTHPISENADNFAKKLFKDEVEERFFLNKDEWCSLEDYVRIVEKAIEITKNFELTRLVGSLLPQYKKEYKLSEFTEAAFNTLGAFFLGPVEIFRQISFYNSLFNKTKDMEFVSGKNGECIIKIKFKKNVNPVFDFVSEWHIEGMFQSILELFGIKNGKVTTTLKEYDLELLIKEKFKKIKKECLILGDRFYLDNEEIARKISLIGGRIKNRDIYLGDYQAFNEKEGGEWCWLITNDLYMDNKYLVLKKGEIYNAPYFLTSIKWNKIPYIKAVSKLCHSQISNISPLGRGYVRLIQDRQKQEQEATKLRAEKQKIEKEYFDLLLKNYIHPKFIERAKIGPIPFRSVWVTNIFVDIHQSTQHRKKYGDHVFRHKRNIFLKLIKKNLIDTAGEWGWLNKMMGDGCYIVTGAYNYFNDEQDDIHTASALKFITNLYSDIEKIKKENTDVLKDFFVRFAAESGYVEMGESHEAEIDDIQGDIKPGHLRIFDTDGHAVSLAYRLEGTAKQIMKYRGESRVSSCFIGPALMTHTLKNKGHGIKIKQFDLRDLNLTLRDYGDIKIVGEINLDEHIK